MRLAKWMWVSMVAIVLCVPWGMMSLLRFSTAMHTYTPAKIVHHIKIQQWWQQPLDYLPLSRNNRFGHPIQPFNLQWAAPLGDISHLLKQHHWKEIKRLASFKNTLRNILTYSPKYQLPIWPLLYQHHKASLLFIYIIKPQHKIIELRLWKTNVIFTDSKLPLWIGIISSHLLKRAMPIFKHTGHVHFSASGAVTLLLNELHGNESKIITIPRKEQPSSLWPLDWKGHILMVRQV